MPFHTGAESDRISAFWTGDDQYIVCVESAADTAWYRIESEPAAPTADDATRRAIGAMMVDVLPLGAGRIAFPVGSSGRRVYRVWRASKGAAKAGRTRILGVRAGRSHRLPA